MTKVERHFNGEMIAFLTNSAKTIGHTYQKKKNPRILHYKQNYLKMYHKLKYKSKKFKTCTRTTIKILSGPELDKDFVSTLHKIN